MGTIDLTEEDERVLASLRQGRTRVEALATDLDTERTVLAERLARMEESGLVAAFDEDTYELTEIGGQVLEAPANGSADERIDTPAEVDHTIETFCLRADQEAAIRRTFVFLTYWGEATVAEIKDAVYPEHPAGYDSADTWWRQCVEKHLGKLPALEFSNRKQRWQHTEQAAISAQTDDGRQVFAVPVAYGSAKHAIEALDCSESERSAVRAVFSLLYDRGELTEGEIKEEIYDEFPAGFDSAQTWWQRCIRDVLIELPHVERARGRSDGERWRYDRNC